MDPVLRNIKYGSENQIDAWIRDQYDHPLESVHTLDEVLKWFEENNIQYISSIPNCSININENSDLFRKR